MKNSNSLLKIEFLNKNWSFTTVCRWSDKKGKTQTFAQKSCPNCNFRYCITIVFYYVLWIPFFTHLGNGFERCRASELTMATRAHQCHQVLQKLSTTIALRGSQISFTHPNQPKDEMMMLCELRQEKAKKAGVSHIFALLHLLCLAFIFTLFILVKLLHGVDNSG